MIGRSPFIPEDSYGAAVVHVRRVLSVGDADSSRGLYDVATEESWDAHVGVGAGPAVIAGAVSGALDVLRGRDVSPRDVLTCLLVRTRRTLTIGDLHQAVQWLSEGLTRLQDHDAERETVVAVRDGSTDPQSVRSLVRAILVVASHAIEHRRSRVDG